MSSFPPSGSINENQSADIHKIRKCLRCEATFHSQWAGERICPQCKKSAAWRSGAPFTSRSTGNRR